MTAQPWYATREDVKAALDVKETARANSQIDRALEAASRAVEGLCHRRFYPEQDTRRWDWPNSQRAVPWRLWLDSNELISVTSLVTGGKTIDLSDYFLRRSDDRDEPPYNQLQLDIGTSAAFGGGPTTQRAITISGLFGYRNDETTLGTLTAAVGSTTATTISVDGPTSAAVGVGSLLRLDSERVIVTARAQATTGQTLQTPLGVAKNETSVAVTTAAAFAVDEVILLDAEKMRILDIAGNSLIVERAWDGSVLAAHTGSTIYAPRSLTVRRGALGTTAATHLSGAPVYRWDPPGPVQSLTIAQALDTLLQEQAGYVRTTKTATGKNATVSTTPLDNLRGDVYTSHGRKARLRGV